MNATTHNHEPAGPAALGAVLRNLRRSRGLAQRDLLQPLHLGSHSAIVDYEAGRRIPSTVIITGYEKFFGLRPGSLRRLRDRALAERAAAEARAARPGSGTGSSNPVPRQLPATTEIFTGRAAELAQLDRLLRDRHASAPVVISAVSGMGGIGKTALAVHWAHQARESFGDGELYIDMQGYHPSGRPVAADAALGQFLVALGVAADRIPAELPERSALFRSLMTGRRMLVLLDNVRDVEQVRPLLPGSADSRVLITSRSRLSGLAVRDGAQRIGLDVLDPRDGVQLLRRTIGSRASSEPGAIAALASLCAMHPLALLIAAERVAAGQDSDIGSAVAQLTEPSARLANLAVADDDASAIRKVFAWSYQALPIPAGRLFRLLGLNDGPDISLAACAALAGLGTAECAGLIGVLVDAHLVDEHTLGRFRLHDLLRLFARECLLADEPESARDDAALMLAAWYLASACAARTALDPHLPGLDPVDAGLAGPAISFSGDAAALTWFDQERANLTATALSAQERGLHEIGWKLPTALFPFFDLRRHYGDWIATHQSAITAARDAGDREAEGKVQCNLGSAYRPMLRFEEAASHYEQALRLFREVGWRQGEAKVLGNLANTHEDGGDYARAVAVGQVACSLLAELGDAYGEALCMANLGNAHTALGELNAALEIQRRALDQFRALGDRRGAARALGGLGIALTASGRANEAVPMMIEAARTFQELGDQHMQASTLADLARAYADLGLPEEAGRCARRSREIFVAIGENWMAAALMLPPTPSPSCSATPQ